MGTRLLILCALIGSCDGGAPAGADFGSHSWRVTGRRWSVQRAWRVPAGTSSPGVDADRELICVIWFPSELQVEFSYSVHSRGVATARLSGKTSNGGRVDVTCSGGRQVVVLVDGSTRDIEPRIPAAVLRLLDTQPALRDRVLDTDSFDGALALLRQGRLGGNHPMGPKSQPSG